MDIMGYYGIFWDIEGLMFFQQDLLKSEGRNDADPGINTRPGDENDRVHVQAVSALTYLLVFWSTHQSPASHHLTSRGQSGPCICRDGRLIDLRVHRARASTGGRVPPWGGFGLWWGSPLWASPPGARRPRVSEAPSLTRCYPLCLSFFLRSLASSILVVS